MTHQYISLLYRGLVALGAFASLEVAYADPCSATAVLSGEPSLVAELSETLAQRDISLQGAPGCAAIQANVSSHDNQVMVVLQDTSGRSETFIVAELATAASLIEAWSRVALETILPPGVDAPTAPTPGAVHQIEDEDDPTDEGINEEEIEAPQADNAKSLTINAEHLPGGFRADGKGLRASLNVTKMRRFTLSVDARGYQKPSGGNFSLLFASLDTEPNPTKAKALYQGIELLARASAPLAYRRLSLAPSVALGPGFVSARELVSNIEFPVAKAFNVTADSQLSLVYQVTKRIEAQAYYSMSTVVLGRRSASQDIAFTALAEAPDFQERLGMGLSYQF